MHMHMQQHARASEREFAGRLAPPLASANYTGGLLDEVVE